MKKLRRIYANKVSEDEIDGVDVDESIEEYKRINQDSFELTHNYMKERYSRIAENWSNLDTKVSVVLALNGLILAFGRGFFISNNFLNLISGLFLSYSMLLSLMVLFLPYRTTRGLDEPEKFEKNLSKNEKDFLLMKFHKSSLDHNEKIRNMKIKGAIEAAEFTALNLLILLFGLVVNLGLL
ncbi:MAG: hypothetical protein ABEJ95_05980 [Candidatus Nanohalobium sp.]